MMIFNTTRNCKFYVEVMIATSNKNDGFLTFQITKFLGLYILLFIYR